jgi:hypothetical protein
MHNRQVCCMMGSTWLAIPPIVRYSVMSPHPSLPRARASVCTFLLFSDSDLQPYICNNTNHRLPSLYILFLRLSVVTLIRCASSHLPVRRFFFCWDLTTLFNCIYNIFALTRFCRTHVFGRTSPFPLLYLRLRLSSASYQKYQCLAAAVADRPAAQRCFQPGLYSTHSLSSLYSPILSLQRDMSSDEGKPPR